MQVYIVGIGQCGTSVAFDVISELTGFVKSKDVRPEVEGAEGAMVASNTLLTRLDKDLERADRWKAYVGPWLSRWFGPDTGRKTFIRPKIAIIDGNPNNFVKDAFDKFSDRIAEPEGDDADNTDLVQLVKLIRDTQTFGLGEWKDGCANGLVGEVVSTDNLRLDPGMDLGGQDGDDVLPISIFLVVSSGGGATGSGGATYLAKTDALLRLARKEGVRAQNRPSPPIIVNAIVLPSLAASSDNRKYALNTGRALARHSNAITAIGDNGNTREKPSSVILFSNPNDEGDSRALQRLNNYLAEFAIRLANFAFPGNVARIARDVDTRELVFLRGKTCVLAMSHLSEEHWGDDALESVLVERAFANLYESSADKPYGLSVESMGGGHDPATVLETASSAMVVVGVPPTFQSSLSVARISGRIKEHSGSKLESGVGTFAYGSAKHLELTIFLRYRSMKKCPLAMHFVTQYVGEDWSVDAGKLLEAEHIAVRARRDEQDDKYAETFETIEADLREFSHLMSFDAYVVHRLSGHRKTQSSRSPDTEQGEAEDED